MTDEPGGILSTFRHELMCPALSPYGDVITAPYSHFTDEEPEHSTAKPQ